jgi:branched-chain amino acid transport system substrate-binding protein
MKMTTDKTLTRSGFLTGAAATGLGVALGGMAGPARAMTAAALAKKPIVIGTAVAATGGVSYNDLQDQLKGVTLAIEEINASGGVRGRMLKSTTAALNVLDAPSTQTAFQQLVSQKVDAITCAFAPIVEVAGNVTAAYGCPYINGDTSQAGIDLVESDPTRYSNLFTDPPEIWYGRYFPHFLDQMKTRGWTPTGNTVHIVQTNVNYDQVISQEAQKAIGATGGRWQVAATDTVTFPTLDWTAAIARLHQTNPAVIMIAHFDAGEEAAFCKQFAANPVKGALVYLQYGPSQREFLQLAGSDANGFVWSTVIGIVPDSPRGKAFLAKYTKRFGGAQNPSLVYNGFGYDNVHILARAWNAVGDPRKFDAVNDYIRRTPFQGVLGRYDFNTDGQEMLLYPDQTRSAKAGTPHLYFQVQNGRHVALLPRTQVAATRKYVAPPWA